MTPDLKMSVSISETRAQIIAWLTGSGKGSLVNLIFSSQPITTTGVKWNAKWPLFLKKTSKKKKKRFSIWEASIPKVSQPEGGGTVTKGKEPQEVNRSTCDLIV